MSEFCESISFSITFILTFLLSILFTICVLLLALTFSIRKTMHPVFCTFFCLEIASYCLYSGLIIPSKLAILFGYPDLGLFLRVPGDFVFYVAITVTVFLLLERLFATLRFKTYEYERHWWMLWFWFPVATVFGLGITLTSIGDLLEPLRDYFFLAISGVIFMVGKFMKFAWERRKRVGVMLLIFTINRKLTIKYIRTGRADLTTRFQLAENIKAFRLVLPYLMFHNLTILLDLLMMRIFRVRNQFWPQSCDSIPNYLPLYIVGATIRALIGYAMPLSVLIGNRVYRIRIERALCGRKRESHKAHVFRSVTPSGSGGAKVTQIKNVLGENVKLSATQDDYFSQLKHTWG